MQTDAAPPSTSGPEKPSQPERFAHGLRQTWELELVISGAVAFALLQLPSAVDAAYERIEPHFAGALVGGAFIVYYYARRHNAAIERRCPGVKPLREEGLQLVPRNAGVSPAGPARQVLRCIAEIHRVTLDGKPVPGLEFHFTSHLETGLRGIVGYIPTAGLPRGSHLLRVEALPRAEPREDDRPPDPYLIRFWI